MNGKLLFGCGIAAVALTCAVPAMAQEHSFDVPSQPIASAISMFGRQAHIQIVAPLDGFEGVRSVELRGRMDARSALLHLIGNSGLQIVADTGDQIILGKAQAPGGSPGAPETDTNHDDIVVTARRREEKALTVPIAVTVVNGETLAERNITRGQDIAKLTSGLEVNAGAKRSGGSFAIRGQSATYPFTATSQGVVTYFNEIPTSTFELYDMKNLQVLKGPQGTLFGRVTTGGAVLLTPQSPSFETSGQARASYGAYGTRRLEAAVGGSVIDDLLAVRVAGMYRASNGFTKNVFLNKEADSYSVGSLRFSALLTPADWIRNTTLVQIIRSNEPPASRQIYSVQPFGAVNASTGVATGNIRPIPASIAALAGVPCPNGNCPSWLSVLQGLASFEKAAGPGVISDNADTDGSNEDFDIIQNITDIDLGRNVTLRNLFGYSLDTIRSNGATGQDGTFLPIHEAFPATGPVNRQFVEELQVQASFLGGRLKTTTGAYFEYNKSPNYTRTVSSLWAGFGSSVAIPGAGASADQISTYQACIANPDSEVNSGYCHNFTGHNINSISKSLARDYAFYGQADMAITDRLHLTAGLRRTSSLRNTQSASFVSNQFGLTLASAPTVARPDLPFEMAYIPGYSRAFAVPVPSADYSAAGLTKIRQTFQKLTWSASLGYQFNKDLFAYGSVRTGYKAGGVNPSAPPELQQYGPEGITDYEIGLKSNWNFGGVSGRTTIDFYRDDYTDIQRTNNVVVTTAAGMTRSVSLTQNVAAARIQGFDIESFVKFSDWVDVNGYFSYTDAKYLKWPNTGALVGSGVPATADLTQFTLSNATKFRWGLQPAVHIFAIPENRAKVTLSANVYYQGRHATSDVNGIYVPEAFIPAATKADLRLDIADINHTGMNFAVAVTNVTNDRNVISRTVLSTIEGLVVQQFAEPRIWYLEASYKF